MGREAIYTAGVASAASFSNPVVKENVTGTIVGFVRRLNNQAIAGATVSAGGYSATTNTGGAYSLILPVGSYTVTASAPGFNTRIYEGISSGSKPEHHPEHQSLHRIKRG